MSRLWNADKSNVAGHSSPEAQRNYLINFIACSVVWDCRRWRLNISFMLLLNCTH